MALDTLLDKTLKKAQDAELYSVRVEKYPVKFSGNKLKSIKSQLTRGTGLRVKHNGRLGFSADTLADNADALVDRAIASAKLGQEINFNFCKDDNITPVDIFDPRTVAFEIEEAVEMGQKLINHIREKAPDTINDVNITKYFMEVTYMSDWNEKTYYKTLLTRSVSCMQVTPDGLIYIDESDASCRVPGDVLSLARKIIDKLPLTKQVYEMPSKPTTVIFHPKAVYNITSSLISGLCGTNLVSGISPVLGKFNRQVLDPRFTMADDPTIALESESEGFDGEGLPRRRQVLYDQGVLSNYLLDINTASKLGMESNACATRSASTPPTPGASNLIISGGDVPLDDMISGIKEGLLVEEVIGGGQSNVIAGEFSTNVSLGFKIENGRKVGRVRNTMIAGNFYELLRNNLVALSVERENYHSILSPYIMFRDLSVSGKG
jgi:PmbA protein